MRRTARQLVRFAVVGGAAFVLGAGVIEGFVRAGVSPFIAQVPALAAAVSFTWWFNRRWTFAAGRPPSWHEFARYVAASAGGLAVNAAAFSALTLVALAPVPAYALATIAAMGFNFASYRYAVFIGR